MTIGRQGDTHAFEELYKLRELVSKELEVKPTTLDLSMGMSGDYDKAVRCEL